MAVVTITTYDIGDTAKVTYTFRNSAGALVDPTTVTFTLVTPAGVQTVYTYGVGTELVRDSLGVYSVSLPVTTAGRWRYRFASTAPADADEGSFTARDSVVAEHVAEVSARAELERKLALDMEPTLSAGDVDRLLERAKRPDAAGLVPSDVAWIPTWDTDAAAADGWELKAGRSADGFNFATDGQQFSRKQVFDQCMAMAKLYRRGSGSATAHSRNVEDATDALVRDLPI